VLFSLNPIAMALVCFCGVGGLVQAERPNVVVLLADDLGYSDLGCYGGEIQTPNIDRLAGEGLRFSHFRASPMCVTSRVALLSGMPFHRAGGNRYSHSLPLPIILRQAGYRTMMTGKWHAGIPDPRSRELFDRSFGFLSGMTDSFVGADDWFLDDQPFNDFDADFYSSDAFATKSIEFMEESVTQHQPFFMYVAFNAPHHPCQAPEAIVKKYEHRYDQGYQAIRDSRHRRQIAIGIQDDDSQLAVVGEETRKWDQLTPHRRRVESARMAAYAAAVDGVDTAVGRILAYLKQADLEDNTIVFFLSDNGGDYSNGSIEMDEQQVAWKPHNNPSSSNGWASVKATPFRYYKHSCHEGGIATPMIIRWPAGSDRPGGEIERSPASITDLYPTLIELAETDYPKKFKKRTLRSLTGASILPLLHREGIRPSRPDFQHYDFSRAWIQEEWKAVSLYDGPWQLFNLRKDRSELHDLADVDPERLESLKQQWLEQAREAEIPNSDSTGVAVQQGWGWHRLQMICPSLTSLSPANSTTCDPDLAEIVLSFDDEIDFRGSEDKRIQLFSVSDETNAIWQASPDQTHQSQGTQEIRFTNLPTLQRDHDYYFLWDAGWVKIGGRPIGRLNNGAFWWRFRTPAATELSTATGTQPISIPKMKTP
jgi:arylsulfatase